MLTLDRLISRHSDKLERIEERKQEQLEGRYKTHHASGFPKQPSART